MGNGVPIFNLLQEFLTERRQCITISNKFNNMQPVQSGVPQGCVLGPLLFIIFTTDLGNNLENKIVYYANDTQHWCTW